MRFTSPGCARKSVNLLGELLTASFDYAFVSGIGSTSTKSPNCNRRNGSMRATRTPRKAQRLSTAHWLAKQACCPGFINRPLMQLEEGLQNSHSDAVSLGRPDNMDNALSAQVKRSFIIMDYFNPETTVSVLALSLCHRTDQSNFLIYPGQYC